MPAGGADLQGLFTTGLSIAPQQVTATTNGTGIDFRDCGPEVTALEAVGSAITTVANQRGVIGAVGNRLETTIANLTITGENLTAAESLIRDVDMAFEMANYTKQQIMVQAGTAMLAQANLVNQSVLTLLG